MFNVIKHEYLLVILGQTEENTAALWESQKNKEMQDKQNISASTLSYLMISWNCESPFFSVICVILNDQYVDCYFIDS